MGNPFGLPAELLDLSPVRQKKLYDVCCRERNDAAMIAICIGMKGLNHVYGHGLGSLAKLSEVWNSSLVRFYENWPHPTKPAIHPDSLTWHMPISGKLITDIRAVFGDLSERRRRQIMEWLVVERYEAANNAVAVGMIVIHDELGYGQTRRDRLWRQWSRDIQEFYADRAENEPLFKQWLEDIGFEYTDGRLFAYTCDQTGKFTKKATADKWADAK